MKAYEELYQLLLRSFDEVLTEEEQTALNVGLEYYEELRVEARKLNELNDLFGAVEYGYVPNFEDEVFDKLKGVKPAQKERNWLLNLEFLFPKVAFSSLTIIGLLVLVVYTTNGSVDLDTILGISELSEETISSLEYLDK